ncbi:MAG: molybdenum cofactor guanylyltransferase MobA [Pseudomonadota bacterium]|nr:molybdenum cofactor guanylyltransferase MobA [Pseudomonadota bacterium]
MIEPGLNRIAGLVLAGGAGRRMGGPKALLDLGGRTLLAHVTTRLAPQCAMLAVAAGDNPGLDVLVPTVLPDAVAGGAGPLAGILAGLEWLPATGCDWLLSAPVDGPFLPPDLAGRLLSAAGEAARIVTAASGGRAHHTTALWHASLAVPMRRYLAEGGRAVHRFIAAHPPATVVWPGGRDDPFANINTPEDLERARLRLD